MGLQNLPTNHYTRSVCPEQCLRMSRMSRRHTCNPSTRKSEARGQEIGVPLKLHRAIFSLPLPTHPTNPNPILTLGTEPRTLDLIDKYSTIKLNPQPHDPILKIKPGGCRDGPAIQSADQVSLRTDSSNHETSWGSLMYLCDLSNEAHIDKRVAETIGLKPSEKHVFCLAKRPCLEGMNWRVIETHTPMPSCGPRESHTHKYAHLPRTYINNNKHQSPGWGGLFQGDFYSLP